MTEIYDNIREIYKFSLPCGELANYIDFFSESSLDKTNQLISTEHFSVKMFQSWTPTFWFNFGTPYYIEYNNKRHLVKKSHDILLLRNDTVTRYASCNDHIFTVKFFPGGLEAILGINQAKLIDKIIPLSAIIPSSLTDKIKNKNSFEERIKLLQDHFLKNLKRGKGKDYYLHFVKEVIENYQAENFILNTSQMAEKMFVSSKTINRYFNAVLGISPKKYFSIVRARTALTEFMVDKKTFVPEQFGYYDMSHFYKEISNFTQ
ncbi:MAG: helix-turn-helix domain-containing protein [Ferruginibacter sp.]